MKGIKRLGALTLCAAALLGLSGCWLLAMESVKTMDITLPPEVVQEVMSDFAEEIAYLEEKYDVEIHDVDTAREFARIEAIEWILRKEEKNPFGEFLDRLALESGNIRTQLLNEAARLP